MRTKILFVTYNLNCDGAVKSLISLLSALDYQLFDVDLLLFDSQNNFFKDLLPKQVKIINPPREINAVFSRLDLAIVKLFKMGKIGLLLARGCLYLSNVFYKKNLSKNKQKLWNVIKNSIPIIEEIYDIAVGFQDIIPGYFVMDKVKASIKIAWNHNNYSFQNRDSKIDRLYFSQIDYLITVSSESKLALEKVYPEFASKILVIRNIISSDLIKRMSEEVVCDISFKRDVKLLNNELVIVTVARLDYQKGVDLIVPTCKLLSDAQIKVRWYLIGGGSEEKNIRKLIQKNRITNLYLLGQKLNPYPYIKQADLYVQPSRAEGYGITVAEAKSLAKPIIVTDIPVFHEQIINGENGIFAPLNAQGIFDKIRQLIEHPDLRTKLTRKLETEKSDENEAIQKLYSLLSS